MPATPDTVRCRGCASSRIQLVVDLGALPNADSFPAAALIADDPVRPLELWHCRDCALVQLGPVAVDDAEEVLAIESQTSRRCARDSVVAILSEHPTLVGGSVTEFASHHGGSWLPELQAAGCRVVDHEAADLVVDVHGLAHEPATSHALAQRVGRMRENGLLVLEFHHLLPLVAGTQFDTIRHGHWSYLSAIALADLGQAQGLVPVSARTVNAFGGSLRMAFAREPGSFQPDGSVDAVIGAERAAGLDDPDVLRGLHAATVQSAQSLRAYLIDQRDQGRSVAGYGAPSKATVLLGVSGVGTDLLPFTVDQAAAKHGRRIPGCRVPIHPVDALRQARPEIVLLLTWDIAAEVVADLERDGGWGAEYVVPLPTPHVFGG